RWNAMDTEHRRRKRDDKRASDGAASTPIPWAPVLLCIAVIFMNWSVGATLMALGPYFGDVIFGIESYAITGYAVSCYMILAATSQWLHRRVSLRPAL